MESTVQRDWPTIVAGIGSPHGDDQAGWRVAALLARRAELPARVIRVHEPTQILEALPGCQQLIIVDACHSGGVAGTILRFTWPDARIATAHRHSTHGVGIADVLRLAEKLDQLPPVVDVLCIEAGNYSPGEDVTPRVARAVAEVEGWIVRELCEAAHA
jgi:hydrogenase maturation protease